jgi:hypothetical protein
MDDIQLQLYRIVNNLKPTQIALLLEMARAMTVDIEEYVNESSDIVSTQFATNFSNRLLIHHATHAEKFGKKAFEYAFANASIATGKSAKIVSSLINPGTDVVVDEVNFSLKTEASARINRKKITISKLMEARWIRECNSRKDFANGVATRVTRHLQQYQRILMLRAYSVSRYQVKYELIEIPHNLLLNIRNLSPNDFTDKTASGSCRAYVYVGENKAFTLSLDGSVEKVTILGLDTDLCFDHASWIIPTFTEE